MNEDALKVLGVVAVIAISLGAFAAVISGRLQTGGSIADVDAQGFEDCAFGHEYTVKGRGRFEDLATDARKHGEVFSTTRLWFAWFKDGESRPVTIQARAVDCGGLGVPTQAASWYRFTYSEDRITWTGFTQDRVPSGGYAGGPLGGAAHGGSEGAVVNLKAFEIIIDGAEFKPCTFGKNAMTCTPGTTSRAIKDGAVLRVEAFLQRYSGGATFRLVQDEIELRSAIARARWERPAYKVGETACATWEVPTATYADGGTSRPAYFLTILDMNLALPVGEWDRKSLTATTGRACIPVTADLFSNDLQTCQNRLRVELLSPIIVADVFDTAVQPAVPPEETQIGAGDPPEVTEVTFDKAEYQEGDTVIVRWKTSGNVTKVHVTLHINGALLLDDDFDGSVTEASTAATLAGTATAQVTAYNYCTPSPVKSVYATVGNKYPGMCELFPDLPECTGTRVVNYLLAALAVIAVVGVLLVGLYAGGKLTFLPEAARPLVGIVGAVVTALVLVNAGWFDALLGV